MSVAETMAIPGLREKGNNLGQHDFEISSLNISEVEVQDFIQKAKEYYRPPKISPRRTKGVTSLGRKDKMTAERLFGNSYLAGPYKVYMKPHKHLIKTPPPMMFPRIASIPNHVDCNSHSPKSGLERRNEPQGSAKQDKHTQITEAKAVIVESSDPGTSRVPESSPISPKSTPQHQSYRDPPQSSRNPLIQQDQPEDTFKQIDSMPTKGVKPTNAIRKTKPAKPTNLPKPTRTVKSSKSSKSTTADTPVPSEAAASGDQMSQRQIKTAFRGQLEQQEPFGSPSLSSTTKDNASGISTSPPGKAAARIVILQDSDKDASVEDANTAAHSEENTAEKLHHKSEAPVVPMPGFVIKHKQASPIKVGADDLLKLYKPERIKTFIQDYPPTFELPQFFVSVDPKKVIDGLGSDPQAPSPAEPVPFTKRPSKLSNHRPPVEKDKQPSNPNSANSDRNNVKKPPPLKQRTSSGQISPASLSPTSPSSTSSAFSNLVAEIFNQNTNDEASSDKKEAPQAAKDTGRRMSTAFYIASAQRAYAFELEIEKRIQQKMEEEERALRQEEDRKKQEELELDEKDRLAAMLKQSLEGEKPKPLTERKISANAARCKSPSSATNNNSSRPTSSHSAASSQSSRESSRRGSLSSPSTSSRPNSSHARGHGNKGSMRSARRRQFEVEGTRVEEGSPTASQMHGFFSISIQAEDTRKSSFGSRRPPGDRRKSSMIVGKRFNGNRTSVGVADASDKKSSMLSIAEPKIGKMRSTNAPRKSIFMEQRARRRSLHAPKNVNKPSGVQGSKKNTLMVKVLDMRRKSTLGKAKPEFIQSEQSDNNSQDSSDAGSSALPGSVFKDNNTEKDLGVQTGFATAMRKSSMSGASARRRTSASTGVSSGAQDAIGVTTPSKPSGLNITGQGTVLNFGGGESKEPTKPSRRPHRPNPRAGRHLGVGSKRLPRDSMMINKPAKSGPVRGLLGPSRSMGLNELSEEAEEDDSDEATPAATETKKSTLPLGPSKRAQRHLGAAASKRLPRDSMMINKTTKDSGDKGLLPASMMLNNLSEELVEEEEEEEDEEEEEL